jgi:hypothetical protein
MSQRSVNRKSRRPLLLGAAVAVLAVSVAAASCGGAARTSAATQTGAKAFDAAASDPKAIAVADQLMAAVGGEANWVKAKQLQWTQVIAQDGKVVNAFHHAWDRWNGRHQFTRIDPDGKLGVTMHDLFSSTGSAVVNGQVQMKSDVANMIKEASTRFGFDAYPLTIPFKLKDPGVHLKFSEERPEEGSAKGSPMKYDVIQITFDQGVGPSPGDTYYLQVSKETHLPNILEYVAAGKSDDNRAGWLLDDWKEVGGLKFATRRTTLGYTRPDAPKAPLTVPPAWKGFAGLPPDLQVPNPGQVLFVTNIKVDANPDDELYVPQVK